MRYVQLRAFHYVAIAGGFSRAAEALHLTQPAISDQVRKLETEYDVRLFNRDKKQITLTSSGEKLLDITRRMFEIEDQAMELLSQSRAVRSGRLAIIADSAHHVTGIIRLFREKYPGVFVSISAGNTGEVLASLNNFEADIGVLGEIPEGREYELLKLSSTPIIAFASATSPIARQPSIRMQDLAKLPLVMREPGSKTRAKFEDFAAKSGIALHITIEAEGREAVREIVASGDGVGIVSQAEFGGDPRFVQIPISNANLVMDEALVSLRERQESKLIRAFMQVAREQVAT
ncbi:MAG: LysR family transcriptional regulator [Nitratireductor sp.]|nr:LysR family transcriptional regulator [Nitratireductor sp.]